MISTGQPEAAALDREVCDCEKTGNIKAATKKQGNHFPNILWLLSGRQLKSFGIEESSMMRGINMRNRRRSRFPRPAQGVAQAPDDVK
jgi:hypothetical protein